MPQRIQRKRTKGWRLPDGAVYVGRPTKYGNPFVVLPVHAAGPFDVEDIRRGSFVGQSTGREGAMEIAVRHYAAEPLALINWDELKGRDLVCWCPLDAPCHADVLLDIANKKSEVSR